jgi:serine/threonine kinase 38
MKLKEEDEAIKELKGVLEERMLDLNLNQNEKASIKKEILKKDAEHQRLKRTKITQHDFEPIAIIGRGAFGEVRLCRHKDTTQIIAIKKMKKK